MHPAVACATLCMLAVGLADLAVDLAGPHTPYMTTPLFASAVLCVAAARIL